MLIYFTALEVWYPFALISNNQWSGSSMVSALILHAFRVYLTGGFKKARELIWMTGIILGVCTVLFGVTGY
jgi:cytochrome b6